LLKLSDVARLDLAVSLIQLFGMEGDGVGVTDEVSVCPPHVLNLVPVLDNRLIRHHVAHPATCPMSACPTVFRWVRIKLTV